VAATRAGRRSSTASRARALCRWSLRAMGGCLQASTVMMPWELVRQGEHMHALTRFTIKSNKFSILTQCTLADVVII
jgi:hypothetical protein